MSPVSLFRLRRPHRAGRFALVGVVLGGALTAATGSSAVAQTPPAGQSVTALGLGQVKVKPKDRHSNASIVAAVEAAEAKAVPQAIDAARERAQALAKASGLTLGAIESVQETPPSPFGPGYGYGGYPAPFGKDRYCGTERRPRFRRTSTGRRRVVGFRNAHVCQPPRYVLVNLSVTFAAT
jgi:hypothetical protein